MAEGQVTDTDPISRDPTSVAAPKPAKPDMGPDPYELFQQRGGEIEKTTANIERLSAERRAKAFEPLPRVAPPDVKNIEAPPQSQYQNIFKEAMNPLIFLTAMGAGLMSKNRGMGAMKAATGFMEGFQEGDQKRIELEKRNWRDNMEQIVANNKVAVERYNAALYNNNISLTERQAQIQAIAWEVGDQVTIDTMKQGRYDLFAKMQEARQRAVTQLEDQKWRQDIRERELAHRKEVDAARIAQGDERIDIQRQNTQIREDARRATPGGMIAQEVQLRMDKKMSEGMPREQAFNEANHEVRQATASSLTGNQVSRLQDRVDMVDNTTSYLDKAETLLNKHFGIAGIGGMITRPMERVSNVAGISNATDRAEFERYVNEIKLWAPQVMLHRGGRPLSTEAARLDRIVAGLSIGDTAANTKKNFKDLRELLKVIGEQTRRQIPGGGQPAIPIPEAGTTPRGGGAPAGIQRPRNDRPWEEAPRAE